ncbi:MAG: SDR family oxidoreductase [Eubacteriales bacterium]
MITCIITGAGTGIGRATAIALSNVDDIENLVLISLGLENLKITKSMMNCSKNIIIYDQDITRFDEVEEIIGRAYKQFGSIDILLNIAGYVCANYLEDITLDIWEKTFKVNVTSVFMLSKFVVKYMKKKGGIILNIASTSGSTPRPGWLAYAASKSAVIGISRTLSEELKDYNIRIYNLSPGRCATDMRKEVVFNENLSEIMQPEEVANVIRIMVSSEENCLDGQDIIVRKMIGKK